uniref:Arrestin C-terminal-like domain-containing protein n=1 Tax=Parascaris univalens TaxID=6257 RepID=A0A915A8Q9_PARUN
MSDEGATSIFKCFELELDAGKNPIFHGGELITGTLKVELKRPMTIEVIKLQFKGRAACTNNDSRKGAEIEKVYFDRDFTLLERPPGRPEPGHFPWIANFAYSLPFECPLPMGCPTSYEGLHAFIRYHVRATIVEDDGTGTHEYAIKKPLMVVAPMEAVPETAAHPVGASESVSFGGCCCRGKLAAEAQLPKSTYFPGEFVIGSLKIDNRHPRHVVDQVEVRLVDRATRVDASSGATSTCRTILHHKLDKSSVVKSKSSMHKDDVIFLQVPPVVPSTPGVAAAAFGSDIYTMSPDEKAPTLASKLMESPGSATLRFRKQPFIRIDYAIQVSLGAQLLLELPITINALPTEGEGIAYEPFAGGEQSVVESDEVNKLRLGDGFVFTPRYPVLTNGQDLSAHAVNGPTTENGAPR